MSIRSQIQSNIIRSYLFMGVFTLLVVLVAYVFGQATGYGDSYIGIALLISVISGFISYYFSDSIVLAMSGARPADKKKDFHLFTVTENLSLAAGIPMPRVYVIEDTAMNAFATGRDAKHATICATTGLVNRLDRRELEGVIAHELSHIQNYDIRLMAVVSILAGTIAYAADMFLRNLWWSDRRSRDDNRDDKGIFLILGIVLALITPLIASIIQLAISRKREFAADASGALLTRYPEGLARALEKIGKDHEILEGATNATAHLFITNPFKGKEVHAWFSNLFNTHPPIEERIRILREM